uniref:TerD domain-containing protein n=1 Tax=Eutreptiella gymnastica TaxID=73025 RepID=A0A7S1HUT5_9EUGL|mmetsp:Transcript_107201/g.184906  ORF Transcript_107201/g.184906 Transcript_107201/m.184906 type:complete len:941 (+) Transcript_107201:106-2928(+)
MAIARIFQRLQKPQRNSAPVEFKSNAFNTPGLGPTHEELESFEDASKERWRPSYGKPGRPHGALSSSAVRAPLLAAERRPASASASAFASELTCRADAASHPPATVRALQARARAAPKSRRLAKPAGQANPFPDPALINERVATAMNRVVAQAHPCLHLECGQAVDLLGAVRRPTHLWVGVQWDTIPDPDGDPVEVDVLAFGLDARQRCTKRKNCVSWSNKRSEMDALIHADDGKDGDEETVCMHLYRAKMAGVASLAIVVNIRDAHGRGQQFADNITSISVTIYTKFGSRHKDIVKVVTRAPFEPGIVAMEVARLVRTDQTWRVQRNPVAYSCQARHIVAQYLISSSRRALEKGELFHLVPEPQKTMCLGLAWVPLSNPDNPAAGLCPLDAIVVMLDSRGRQVGPFVTPKNPRGPGVFHHASSRSWDPEDDTVDCETIEMTFDRVPLSVYQILVVVIIDNQWQAKGYTYNKITGSSFRLYVRDKDPSKPGVELCRHDLPLDLSLETAVEFMRLTRDKDGNFGMLIGTGDGAVCDSHALAEHFRKGTWLMRMGCQHLKWGDRLNVTRGFPELSTATVGVGWDTDHPVDLDLLVVLLGANGKMAMAQDLVWAENMTNKTGTVKMTLVSSDGEGLGDDEACQLQLYSLRPSVEQIVFIVAINQSDNEEDVMFGALQGGFIRMYDNDKGFDVLRADLDIRQYEYETALEFGRLIRPVGEREWTFMSKPEPYGGGAAEIAALFSNAVLKPGSSIKLDYEKGPLLFGLGWDDPMVPSDFEYDLDVLVIGLGPDERLVSKEYFIWHKQPSCPDGSIQHLGEVQDGSSYDQETVLLDLSSISSKVSQILFIVRIFDAKARGQHLGAISSMWLRLIAGGCVANSPRSEDITEIFRCTLEGMRSNKMHAIEVGRVCKNKERRARGSPIVWEFRATGHASKNVVWEEKYS